MRFKIILLEKNSNKSCWFKVFGSGWARAGAFDGSAKDQNANLHLLILKENVHKTINFHTQDSILYLAYFVRDKKISFFWFARKYIKITH